MGGHRLRVIGLEGERLIRPRVVVDRLTAASAGQVVLLTMRTELYG